MFVIINDNPSTFLSQSAPVRILDEKKNLFYFHPNKEKYCTFNLPSGKYFTKERVYRDAKFVPYENQFQPFLCNPAEFQILVCKNKNKLTIFPYQKKIFVDEEIVKIPYKPLLVFALGHEFSHTLPEGKDLVCTGNKFNFCDLNSAYYMLNSGYNPSQIKICSNLLLKQNFRTNCLDEHMSNPQYRR